jgi:aquaporin Z
MTRWPFHWREYLSEAFGLGLFMVSACAFGVLLFHPASPLPVLLPSELGRRFLMGLAMGGTALVNAHAPWGKRSGSHLNPAFTLTFTRLGKVDRRDAGWYIAAQFAGGIAGTLVASALLSMWIADPTVHYVATVPGRYGNVIAFAGEVAITALLMFTVLLFASDPRRQRYTAFAAATLITLYITFEAPLSGMSMNPARTFGSALLAQDWRGIWIYFTAPLLGMLFGAELFVRRAQRAGFCAKLDHDERVPCIFCHHGER